MFFKIYFILWKKNVCGTGLNIIFIFFILIWWHAISFIRFKGIAGAQMGFFNWVGDQDLVGGIFCTHKHLIL